MSLCLFYVTERSLYRVEKNELVKYPTELPLDCRLTMVKRKNAIYLFHRQRRRSWNRVLIFDLQERSSFESVELKSDIKWVNTYFYPGDCSTVVAYDQTSDVLYALDGHDEDYVASGDLWRLNFEELCWYKVHAQNKNVSSECLQFIDKEDVSEDVQGNVDVDGQFGRIDASLHVHGNKLYLFGGIILCDDDEIAWDIDKEISDPTMQVFDIEEGLWHSRPFDNPLPGDIPPRCKMYLVQNDQSTMFVIAPDDHVNGLVYAVTDLDAEKLTVTTIATSEPITSPPFKMSNSDLHVFLSLENNTLCLKEIDLMSPPSIVQVDDE